MSTSFPFFAYARQHGIKYGDVLQVARLATAFSSSIAFRHALQIGLDPQQAGDIIDLELREALRRKAIEDELVKR